ncbi:MAG: protein translocase subunit SecD, partial [Candidatus Nanohaloarchaea archaeon]
QPVITGSEKTREKAITEMNQLQSVLKSGALPTSINIVQTTRVSATLGKQFLRTAIIAIIVAILAVALVVYLRYRDPRIVVPLTLTGFSELAMIFGFAAAVGWTIDIPSIAGIIAAVGTGVDDQIIITDERGKQHLRSFKKRFKRAFFIIFTSAASTIGAMLPLTRIGAGEITGFAVTTIAGVVIGVAITRPAYARVLQYMDE